MNRTLTAAAEEQAFNPWRRASRWRFGWTSLASVMTHVGLALLVMHVMLSVPRIAPPIRVSFIDPAPPPPVGNGGGAVAAPAEVPAIVIPPSEPLHVAATAPVKPKPVPRAPRPAQPAPKAPGAAAPAAVAPGQAGEVDGVSGGVPGGLAGGLVGGTGHQLISADQAAQQPVLTKRVVPEYPPMARLRGVEGKVVLEAIVSTTGDVEPDIKVVHSAPLFDAAAITAVRQWRFRPARDQEGDPLRVTFRVPVQFVLH